MRQTGLWGSKAQWSKGCNNFKCIYTVWTDKDVLGNLYPFIVLVDIYLLGNKMVYIDQNNKRVYIFQYVIKGPHCTELFTSLSEASRMVKYNTAKSFFLLTIHLD